MLQLVPLIVLVFPLYSLLGALHLLGSQLGLILATTVISLPMGVMFFNVFFSDLPPEMSEAAAIDAQASLRTLFSIAIPMSRSAFGAVAAFALINTWNEFLLATSLVTEQQATDVTACARTSHVVVQLRLVDDARRRRPCICSFASRPRSCC